MNFPAKSFKMTSNTEDFQLQCLLLRRVMLVLSPENVFRRLYPFMANRYIHPIKSYVTVKHCLVGGLEHFLFFPYICNNHPNWLSYFSEGFVQPPTSSMIDVFFSEISGHQNAEKRVDSSEIFASKEGKPLLGTAHQLDIYTLWLWLT